MLFEQAISQLPFRQWIFEDRENKRLLRLSAIAIIVQFAIFKAFYPFPNFMPPDSFSYLDAAFSNQDINMWAIGYSKFLRLFSSFSNSHVALVIFQYLLLEASLLYFLFSIRYLTAPRIWAFRILIGISILNPLLSHISNFVSSDSLFTTLSLVWFTQLLWILYKPTFRLLLLHAIILLLAFMIRYNSLYFPFISIGVILLAHLPRMQKWMGIVAIFVLVGAFIGRTQYEYYKVTRTVQYSAFGGWQLAANALYGYAHAKPDVPESLPQKFRSLQTVVNHHMDSLNHLFFIFRPDLDIGVYYLWDFKSPLKMYMEKKWAKDTLTPYFNRWATMAPLYADYGRYLIYHHPRPFLKYFVWKNFLKYYAPPTGFMEDYNQGNDKVDAIAATWFGWKNAKIHNNFRDKKIEIVRVFPILFGIANLLFLGTVGAFTALGGFKKSSIHSKQILLLTIILWFSNMLFSVMSAPIELRYQLFPMLIIFTMLCLLLSFIIAESTTTRRGELANPMDKQSNTETIVQVI